MAVNVVNTYTSFISIKCYPFICNLSFMLGYIWLIRWKTLGSSLSIHGLRNLGGVLRGRATTDLCACGSKLDALFNCQQAFLAPLSGIGNTNPREIYLSFWTNPNFIIAYILCFLFVYMNVGKTLDTKWSKSSQPPYFNKFNLAQASWWLHEDSSLVVGANFC
jgi:hypothetical protein